MFHFNGGTVSVGTSLSPIGMYSGYLLMQSGNVWVAACFLLLSIISMLIVLTTLCRYIINYRRIMQMNSRGQTGSI